MSWGIRITLVYIGFVALIASMVIIASSNKSELVAKDYYAQELAYQDRIDAIENEKQLTTSVQYELTAEHIKIFLPAENRSAEFKGEVFFFRPSDASRDLKLPLKFDSKGEYFVARNLLSKGIYKMSISWTDNKSNYYKETIINI